MSDFFDAAFYGPDQELPLPTTGEDLWSCYEPFDLHTSTLDPLWDRGPSLSPRDAGRDLFNAFATSDTSLAPTPARDVLTIPHSATGGKSLPSWVVKRLSDADMETLIATGSLPGRSHNNHATKTVSLTQIQHMSPPVSPIYSPEPSFSRPASPARSLSPVRFVAPPTKVVTTSSSGAWSAKENAACVEEMTEVANDQAFAGTDRRWSEVSRRLSLHHDITRSANAVKNQWNRHLREASKVEDRSSKRSDRLSTSVLTSSSSSRAASSRPTTSTSTFTNKVSSGTGSAKRSRPTDDDDEGSMANLLKKPRRAPAPTISTKKMKISKEQADAQKRRSMLSTPTPLQPSSEAFRHAFGGKRLPNLTPAVKTSSGRKTVTKKLIKPVAVSEGKDDDEPIINHRRPRAKKQLMREDAIEQNDEDADARVARALQQQLSRNVPRKRRS